MTRLPPHLRVFWIAFYLMSLLLVIGVPVGPAVETWFDPVRDPGEIENVGRGTDYLWFDWIGRKFRTPASPGVDVTMRAAGDQFDLTLYNDESRPDEPRCTRLVPWSRSLLVDAGFHRQSFCIEVPRTVGSAGVIDVDVAPRYRGLLGLWEVRSPFPPFKAAPQTQGDRARK